MFLLAQAWLIFILCAAVIIYSGNKLTVAADSIADNSSWGQTFIGFILLSLATSMPEMVTTISSVTLVDAEKMALGNIFGSNMFNLLLIALVSILAGKFQIHNSQTIRAAWLSIFFTLVVALFLAFPYNHSIFKIGLQSFLVFPIFAGIIYLVFKGEKKTITPKETRGNQQNFWKSVRSFAFHSGINFISGMVAAWSCNQISQLSSLGQSFMGVLFLAGATSLPEMVVTISAVRMGAHGLALGNIFGSNIFNLTIIAMADIFFRGGNIFTRSDTTHFIAITAVIFMTMVFLFGQWVMKKIGTNLKTSHRLISPGRLESILLVTIYLVGLWKVYRFSQ